MAARQFNNHVGFETREDSEASAVSGTMTYTTSTVRSGGSACAVSPNGQYNVNPFQFGSDGGRKYIAGVGVHVSATPSTTGDIFRMQDASGVALTIRYTASNTLDVLDANGASIGTISTGIPTPGTFFFMEVVYEHTGSADIEVFIDDVQRLSSTAEDLLGSGSLVRYDLVGPSFGATTTFDDFYCMSGCKSSDERLGSGFHVKGFQNDTNGTTPTFDETGVASAGEVLDNGQWHLLGQTPLDESGAGDAQYSGSGAQGGSVPCNETNADGLGAGPSGDTDVANTFMVGAKHIIRAQRGNGSSTTHHFTYGKYSGSGNATVTVSADLALTSAFAPYLFMELPTSASFASGSDFYVHGVSKSSGGRQMWPSEMWTMLGFVDDVASESLTALSDGILSHRQGFGGPYET